MRPAETELCDAVDFADRVRRSTDVERLAVGTDHITRLESAARALVSELRQPPDETIRWYCMIYGFSRTCSTRWDALDPLLAPGRLVPRDSGEWVCVNLIDGTQTTRPSFDEAAGHIVHWQSQRMRDMSRAVDAYSQATQSAIDELRGRGSNG